MDPDPDLQEQPESTIGHKPAEFKQGKHESPREEHEAGPFARRRARREEAEESDIGGEIRERDAELDSADVATTVAPSPDEPMRR